MQVAFQDALRVFLRHPRWTSANPMFVMSNVPTFHLLSMNYVYKFMCYLNVVILSEIKKKKTRGLCKSLLGSSVYLDKNRFAIVFLIYRKYIGVLFPNLNPFNCKLTD